MQYVFLSFIYRYSQLLNVVSSCLAADVPFVNSFVSNPVNHVRTYGRDRFCYPCR